MEDIQTPPNQLRRARFFWLLMLFNVIIIISFATIFLEGTTTPDEGAMLFTWILIFMMPADIGIQFLFYIFFSNKTEERYAFGGSFIIIVMSLGIAIYGMLIKMLGTSLSQIGWILSIGLSFLALGIGWILTTSLFDQLE
jgi:hypothetical protein